MNNGLILICIAGLAILLLAVLVLLIVLLTRFSQKDDGQKEAAQQAALLQELRNEFDRSRRESGDRDERAAQRIHTLQNELLKQQKEN